MLFPGDTSSFLLLLAFGTAMPMILGFFLVRPIPLPPSESYTVDHHTVEGDPDAIEAAAVLFQHEDASRTHLLSEDSEDSNESDQSVYEGGNTLELSRSRSPEAYRHRSRSSMGRHSIGSTKEYHDGLPNIYGLKLWKNPEFWILFSLLSMLSGTGLMYINNVGAMSQALYARSHPVYDDKEAQKWQAVQVSTISVTNFAGRIIIGLTSDFIKTRLRWPRSYCLVLVSLALLTSQYVATHIENLESLWIASALLGLGYGSVFSLFPSMCIEWFGLLHFSENWGYTSTSPLLGGNLFGIVFGRNLDAHEPPARRGLPAETSGRMCLEGKACYVDALYLTMSACALCVGLSIYAAWRDQKKLAKLETQASITGAYMSGPVWGKIVDARGPRILLASAAVFLLSGFLGIRKLFDDGVFPGTSLTTFCFGVLIASHMLFPGDTSSFLLLLAFGTAIPMVIGFFLVRPIPLPPSDISTADHNDEVDAATVPVLLQHERKRRPLLSEDSNGSHASDRSVSERRNSFKSPPSESLEPYMGLHSVQEYCDGLPNVYGLKLLRTPKFWLLFSLLSMLAGTGLMYSHNVGAMSRALYAHGHPAYNEVEAQKWQAVQVSTFSVTSFAGRIIIGLLSDLVKTWLLWPRSYCLVLSSLTLLTSQYAAICINSPENLWIASEWFGLPHFSENWGYATTSPLISGSLFAIAFGRNLDAHQPVLGDGTSGKMCLEGNACYVDALYMTMSACALCLGLSFYAAWTDQKKLKVAGGK
ncbi:hypothetical protein ONZ45_g1531 [Pleurotus djamor]|nr:hypothetical protein ONZ45_g1531 [Pleurotus djamor]